MAVIYKNTSVKSTNVRFKFSMKQKISRFLFSAGWAVSPGLTKKLVKYFFFQPGSYGISIEQKALLGQARRFSFKSEENVLQAYQWGTGPAVVFVHGWAGRGIQFSRYVSKLTSKGYSVITFDHAGHGRSQGKTANYFLFSNAVYDLFEQLADMDVRAVIAHSLGASAVINYLWRTKRKIPAVFIAPALHLIEMLDQTFRRYGLPVRIFNSLIAEIGEQTHHVFAKENPVDLLKTLTHDIMIIHDIDDRAVAYEDSWNASAIQNNISFFPTKGLGHIRILADEQIIDLVMKRCMHQGQ